MDCIWQLITIDHGNNSVKTGTKFGFLRSTFDIQKFSNRLTKMTVSLRFLDCGLDERRAGPMKRKARKQQLRKNARRRNAEPQQAGQKSDRDADPGRREFMGFLRSWGLIVAGVGGGAWYLIDDFVSTMQELDLTKIGNGIPAVVQVHDPECPRCRRLQSETREAMDSFDDNELQYLVANIQNTSGRDFAASHGVGNVTLLLFDADGKRQTTLVGISSSKSLVSTFRRHIDRHGKDKSAAADK
ncbi:MAG TPA: hypothetical protein DCE33_00545 [Rhodospirillaceae bacterium]|nr:hypothetical protein [Rhodospirillaceae bacterium]